MFVSRCLIYKVHAAYSAVFYFTRFVLVCQELFSSSSLRFTEAPTSGSRSALADSLLSLARSFSFVKLFFAFFSVFSTGKPAFQALARLSERPAVQLDDLIRLPHALPFVKSCFPVLCPFRRVSGLPALPSRKGARLYYQMHESLSTLFSEFFRLLRAPLIAQEPRLSAFYILPPQAIQSI